MDNQNHISELTSLIKKAKDAYYNLSPIISDQEYDALIDELKRLSPNNVEVISVGAPVNSTWEKIKHQIPMGSLNKANTKEEFDSWAQSTGSKEFFITHKIDGSSMELVYENGILMKCVSRGDGIIGDDLTPNAIKIPSIPKKLPKQINIIVRGEVVMCKDVFASLYSSDYANPRNTAAGKIRDQKNNGYDCQNLEFIAYWMITSDVTISYMDSMIQDLKDMGFKVPSWYTRGDINDMYESFNQVKNSRNDIRYEIDGLVISVNDISTLEELGDLNMRPRGQIAWKFDPAMGVTKVLDVKWQVGPTGRITPVAVVEPVMIGGVTITNISLHNISMFNDLNLSKMCRVLISRRNDVIPYIEENLDSQQE